ncbi:hypothetical protein ACHAW5_005565 [Stephanodiscus triporus]|uniref:Protein kinase domain-containing protein n=1 Tax=Stephanodiscus triporus TaxID=2934178 RepID=A0ABD3P4S6_9STRA
MRKYRLVAKKGEGTFSEVIKAQNIKSGTFHAIKCMKSTYTSADQLHRFLPLSTCRMHQVNSLREIQAIKRLSPHPNIITLEEVLFDPPSGRLALVFELLEGNLYELMKDRRQHFDESTVKSFMRQICTALNHMHAKGIFHRDIKPENILVDKRGKHLKLADFGSVRGINSKPPFTEYISTRWYRPPECLLTCGMYGKEMDIWGAGCIMFELSALYPLFPGSDEADQIYRIHSVLGTPNANIVSKLRKHAPPQASFTFPHQEGISLSKLIPSASETYLDLLTRSIAYDAPERITAEEALKHPYFVGGDTFPSATVKSNTDATKAISHRAKITSFVPNPTKISELKKAPETVVQEAKAESQMTKPRSMVSILLARVRSISCTSFAYINTFLLHTDFSSIPILSLLTAT